MSNNSNKIAFLIYNLEHGGAEKVCTLLCNELTKKNLYIELWVINYQETSLTKQLNHNIHIVNINKRHTRNSFFILLKMLIQRKPKSILIFHTELAILIVIIKKLFFINVRVIVRNINTLSHVFNNTEDSWRKYFTYKSLKFALQHSNKIIAQSSGMRDDLIKSFNIESNKIETIFNPAFNIDVNGSAIIEKLPYENEFLYVGRLNSQKGLANLILAFNMAFNTNANIHLTLIGEGEEKQKLEKMVKNLRLTSAITFEGFQAKTLSYYQRAKATVLTSLFEGFPNVLVESISVGTPVIAFDCPSGPADIITPGVNGILVENLNVANFAKAMLSIANDEISFSKHEIIKSADRFSINTTTSKYMKVLTESYI